MPTPEIRNDIELLKVQIEEQEKLLDLALKQDAKFGEAKQIFHSIRLLRQSLDGLITPQKQKNGSQVS